MPPKKEKSVWRCCNFLVTRLQWQNPKELTKKHNTADGHNKARTILTITIVDELISSKHEISDDIMPKNAQPLYCFLYFEERHGVFGQSSRHKIIRKSLSG